MSIKHLYSSLPASQRCVFSLFRPFTLHHIKMNRLKQNFIFHIQLFLLIIILFKISLLSAENVTNYLQSVGSCLRSNETILCMKEKTLDLINDTIYSDQVMDFGTLQVMRDVNFYSNLSEDDIPNDSSRSLALTNVIYEKIEDFFNSRIIKFKLGDIVEGRKKGGGGGYKGGGYGGGKKGGGMLILGGMAMAGMMAQLFMGKIAFMAGAALLLAKMALVLAGISAFKKTSGDGGGKETAHVVYANPENYGGGSHGYGYNSGWHRSLGPEEMHGNMYQNGVVTESTSNSVVQYQTRRKRK